MVIKQIRQVPLWDKDAIIPLLNGLRVAPGSAEYEELGKQLTSSPTKDYCAIGLPMFTPTQPNTSGAEMQCSHCKSSFFTREEQIEHYRLDWHRCNLHRSLAGKAPLTEEQFLNDLSDVSSISGSEDENSDDDIEENDDDNDTERNNPDDDAASFVLRRQARMFFLNADGLVISLYRTVLFSKKCQMDGEQDAIQRVQAVSGRHLWAVILLGGGHFAAGIFNGSDVVIHKTFHNYTVRAKQGGSQSSRDNQSGTSHPKSCGASMRRYNELSQRQHIQELMESWKPQLAQCNLIFCHAKNQNRSTLFTGKNSVLKTNDNRLRTIPFATKRAKFSEVKRVYNLLSEIFVHGTEEEFQSMVKETADKEVKPVIQKKKKKESPSKKPERKPKSERRDSLTFLSSPDESSSEGEIILMTSTMTLASTGLGGPIDECSIDIDKRRRQPKKKNHSRRNRTISGSKKDNQSNSRAYDLLYTACRKGHLEHLAELLNKPLPQQLEGNVLPEESRVLVENITFPENLSEITFGNRNKTMLHIAAENNKRNVIWWLLENGCDPSVADSLELLPYNASKNKDTRNHFRKFMGQHAEKFDYKKANIPPPLTPEEEVEQAAAYAKKKKAKRQAQQEKQKKKIQEEREKTKEEEEKKRFLELSDREKRALAAERRLLQQSEQAGAAVRVLQRCFACAADITGMVPFEYNEFKFCSTKCVREHRTKKT